MRLQASTVAILCSLLFALPAEGQTAELNKKTILRYLQEIVNKRKLDLLGEVFAEKFVRHDLNDSTDTWMTIGDQKKRLSDLFYAFPDFHYTVNDIIAEGDKVVVRAVFQGTQKHDFMNIEPLGNYVSLSEVIFYRLENGKIVERWTQLDLYSLFREMKGKK